MDLRTIQQMMPRQIGTILTVVSALALPSGALAKSRVAHEWSGIAVDVTANRPVQVTQEIHLQSDGFHRLDIQFTNTENQPVTLEAITVTVPIAVSVAADMPMIYGGSDMGRTPILRHAVSEQGVKSQSSFFAMIQLSDDDYVFAGSLSWRIFMPFFTVADNAFVVRSDGEGKQLAPGETIHYEQIVLRRTVDWVPLLDQFGSAIADENGVTALKDEAFTGWATWDYYGRLFTADDIYNNMAELNEFAPDANLIQIDGGWWTERGDYMSVRPDLPGGIKAIVDRIKADGKIPGLHFDGFRGDAAAEIVKTHPEYFLHDQNGVLIVETKPLVDRDMNYTFFDYSHPGARAYIAECIRTMR